MRGLALAVALLAAQPSPAAAPPFDCATPKGWRGESVEGGRVFTAPANADGVPATITIVYYPAGGPDFKDYAEFIVRQAAAGPFDDGPRPAPRDASAGGLKGKRFERFDSELVPPRSTLAKAVAMREETVALRAPKGFFVLRCRAPRSVDRAARRAFAAALKSFKPRP